MEQQTDYFLRQLHILTGLLKKLLLNILKLKDINPTEAWLQINQNLESIVGVDLKQIGALSNDEFIYFLSEKNKFKQEQKMELAAILNASSELVAEIEKNKLMVKALLIYEDLANDNKLTYSIELYSKIAALRKQLNQ